MFQLMTTNFIKNSYEVIMIQALKIYFRDILMLLRQSESHHYEHYVHYVHFCMQVP